MPQWRNIVIFDTNMILRYLLNDNAEMAEEAEKRLNQDTVMTTIEVIAEVVYVLKRIYHMDRDRILNIVNEFLEMVQCKDEEILRLALETYGRENLDFVDCVLYAYMISWSKGWVPEKYVKFRHFSTLIFAENSQLCRFSKL